MTAVRSHVFQQPASLSLTRVNVNGLAPGEPARTTAVVGYAARSTNVRVPRAWNESWNQLPAQARNHGAMRAGEKLISARRSA